MFGLTIIKKRSLESIKAESMSVKVDNANLLNEITELQSSNKILRDRNSVLYQKLNRPRDEKGHFIRKS